MTRPATSSAPSTHAPVRTFTRTGVRPSFACPVSTTHAVVGGIAGAGAAQFGLDAPHWGGIARIAGGWLVSPVIAGAIGAALLAAREVGADRIVNAVAAYEAVGGAVIVVDFGTATTFDVVAADGAVEELAHGEALRGHRRAAPVVAGEVEQVGDEPGHRGPAPVHRGAPDVGTARYCRHIQCRKALVDELGGGGVEHGSAYARRAPAGPTRRRRRRGARPGR